MKVRYRLSAVLLTLFIASLVVAALVAFLHQMLWQEVLLAVLVTLAINLILLLIVWRAYLRPLSRIRNSLKPIIAGDLSQRVETHPVAELDQLGQSVNRVLDAADRRQREMSEKQRSLEQTLAIQKVRAEEDKRDTAHRATAYDAANAIFTATATNTSIRDLAQTALQAIRQGTDADYAWLAMFNEVSLGTFREGVRQQANSLSENVHEKYETCLLVPDWLATDLPDDLEVISRRLLMMDIRATASVPVRAGGKTIGRLDLASKRPRFWTENDFELIEWLGGQLGLAISRLDEYQETLGYSALLSRLVELAGLLNRPLSQEDVIATIGRGVVDLSGAERAAIFQREANGELTVLWQHNLSRRLIRSLISRTRSDPAFFLPVNPVIQVVADIFQLPDEKADWWQMVGLGIRAFASWPLVTEGNDCAVAVSFHDRPVEFSQVRVDVLDTFSRQAAIALRNARLLQAEHEQRLLAEALRDVTGMLAGTLDLSEVIERILTNLDRVVKHDSANMMMLSGDMLRIVRSRGEPLVGIQAREWCQPISMFRLFEEVRDTGRVICVPDTTREPAWVVRPEADWVRSFATAPIRSRGKVIGFLNVQSHEPNFYSSKDANLLQAFADQASLAMENANLFSRTQAAAAESNTLLRALEPLFSAGNDLDTAAHLITQAVVRDFAQAHCTLMLLDKDRNQLRLFRETGKLVMGGDVMDLDGPGISVAAARSREVIYASDVSNDPRYVVGSPEVRSELAIPLVTGGEVVGVLDVESTLLDAFNDASRRILETFAERSAWVISNAMLFKSTRESARQLALLNEITQIALTGGGDPRVTLGGIVRRTAALLQADGAYMTGWDEATQQAIPLAAYGPGEVGFPNSKTDNGERTLTHDMLERGEPLVMEDLQQSELVSQSTKDRYPVRSILGVPLQVNGSKLGAILVGFSKPYHFTEDEIAIVRQAAGQIALNLARMNALADAQNRAEQSERLRRASSALTTTLEVGEVARLLPGHLASLIQFDTLLVSLAMREGIKPIAQRNVAKGDALLETTFPLDDPLVLEIAHNGKPLFLADAAADERFASWDGMEEVHSWLGMPMMAGNEFVGLIYLGRFSFEPFPDDEVLLAQVLANQAGVALQNALLLNRQQRLAMTDPLTGLYNRRGFMELAHHELERSRRFNRPLSLMMIDIDHFKNVNDRYGHIAGDEVMRELAVRFRSVMRESDLLCRYGGEEFCFLLPESEGRGLLAASERVLESINSRPFVVGDVAVAITVSIGVTNLTSPGASLQELISQADLALYQAKEAGRNRVVRYERK